MKKKNGMQARVFIRRMLPLLVAQMFLSPVAHATTVNGGSVEFNQVEREWIDSSNGALGGVSGTSSGNRRVVEASPNFEQEFADKYVFNNWATGLTLKNISDTTLKFDREVVFGGGALNPSGEKCLFDIGSARNFVFSSDQNIEFVARVHPTETPGKPVVMHEEFKKYFNDPSEFTTAGPTYEDKQLTDFFQADQRDENIKLVVDAPTKWSFALNNPEKQVHFIQIRRTHASSKAPDATVVFKKPSMMVVSTKYDHEENAGALTSSHRDFISGVNFYCPNAGAGKYEFNSDAEWTLVGNPRQFKGLDFASSSKDHQNIANFRDGAHTIVADGSYHFEGLYMEGNSKLNVFPDAPLYISAKGKYMNRSDSDRLPVMKLVGIHLQSAKSGNKLSPSADVQAPTFIQLEDEAAPLERRQPSLYGILLDDEGGHSNDSLNFTVGRNAPVTIQLDSKRGETIEGQEVSTFSGIAVNNSTAHSTLKFDSSVDLFFSSKHYEPFASAISYSRQRGDAPDSPLEMVFNEPVRALKAPGQDGTGWAHGLYSRVNTENQSGNVPGTHIVFNNDFITDAEFGGVMLQGMAKRVYSVQPLTQLVELNGDVDIDGPFYAIAASNNASVVVNKNADKNIRIVGRVATEYGSKTDITFGNEADEGPTDDKPSHIIYTHREEWTPSDQINDHHVNEGVENKLRITGNAHVKVGGSYSENYEPNLTASVEKRGTLEINSMLDGIKHPHKEDVIGYFGPGEEFRVFGASGKIHFKKLSVGKDATLMLSAVDQTLIFHRTATGGLDSSGKASFVSAEDGIYYPTPAYPEVDDLTLDGSTLVYEVAYKRSGENPDPDYVPFGAIYAEKMKGDGTVKLSTFRDYSSDDVKSMDNKKSFLAFNGAPLVICKSVEGDSHFTPYIDEELKEALTTLKAMNIGGAEGSDAIPDEPYGALRTVLNVWVYQIKKTDYGSFFKKDENGKDNIFKDEVKTSWKFHNGKPGEDAPAWILAGIKPISADLLPTPTVESVGSVPMVGLDALYQMRDTLYQRYGDPRLDRAGHNGAWVRLTAEEAKADAPFGFKNKGQRFEFGLDRVVSDSADRNYILGGSILALRGKTEPVHSSFKNRTLVGSAYATMTDDSGLYLDVVGRLGRTKMRDFKAYMTGEMLGDQKHPDQIRIATADDASATIGTLSIEAGKRWTFNNGGYLEPQAQVQWGHLGARTTGYRISENNYKVKWSSMNSLLGRLGLQAGYEWTRGEHKGSAYVVGNVLSERNAKARVMMTGDGEGVELDRNYKKTWFSLGLGANLKVRDNLILHGTFEKSFKGIINDRWRVDLGARYLF